MTKPVILLVDRNLTVLNAIASDLADDYGKQFQVLQVNSSEAALSTLKELKLSRQTPALLLANQQMPKMSGAELLEQTVEIFPDAKRVLITDNGLIKPIESAKIDYYLPDLAHSHKEKLYPVLNDLLGLWQKTFMPSFEGVCLIGKRWSPTCYQLRDFLARNWISYRWLDIDTNQEAHRIATCVKTSEPLRFPLMLFPDGTHLIEPTKSQLAEKFGLTMHAEKPFYDLIVIGAGPAGLAAAIYGGSEGLRTVLIERDALGGQAATAPQIENYLGFPLGLSGDDLTRRATVQAKKFGVEVLVPQEVTSIRIEDPYRFVTLANGTELGCYAMIIATGVSYHKLNIPSINALIGAGVYYGVGKHFYTCDDEDIFIVGAGNSAGEAALHFAKHAHRVNIVVRGGELSKGMSQYLIDHIQTTKNIKVWLNTNVVEAAGKDKLAALTILNNQTGERQTLPANALFILIGAKPCSSCLTSALAHDDQGYILSGANLTSNGSHPREWKLSRDPFLLETSQPGIFVAGDIRHDSIKRVASGVGEGSMAVQFVHQYLKQV
jgi:thioredoxin reductase (NADPH)